MSKDEGRNWTVEPVQSMDFYGLRHQPVETVLRLDNGMLLLPSDNGSSPSGTALHFSADLGRHFVDPGGNIAGLHGPSVLAYVNYLSALSCSIPLTSDVQVLSPSYATLRCWHSGAPTMDHVQPTHNENV